MSSTTDYKPRTGLLNDFESQHNLRKLNIEREILLCNSTYTEQFKKTFL